MRDLKSPKYKAWRTKVYKRDKYKCVKCGSTKKLEAHHLKSWNCNEEDRYNVSNGVTLCKTEHEEFHSKYGKGNNTLEQWLEFSGQVKEVLKAEKFFTNKPEPKPTVKLNKDFDW